MQTQNGLPGSRNCYARNADKIDALAVVAERLALKAGHTGITVTDVRREAYRLGILTGYETGRDLSYLSAVPGAAGLEKTEQTRRSDLAVTHGNRQNVWLHPRFAASPYRS